MKVVGVNWCDSGPTTIDLVSKHSGRRAKVEFEADAGLRILEELDLAGIWLGTDRSVLKASWLFEVEAGGWFDLESTRDDFYKKHEAPIREFLVAGYQECVSVFSSNAPKVVELKERSDV
ncbi:hypothetical protein [Pseudothauera lacus]|uniref:hypothetical protein n=1 Tax=Pseudothauera lacus TaxID=2136175 RepID=UPI0011B2278B|nr:hypothetical protein [Pseudothauera lacus]